MTGRNWDDPTGASAMQAAKDRYWSDMFDEGGSFRGSSSYVLPDFRWRAWLDSIDGADLADASVGTKRGMFSPSIYSLLNEAHTYNPQTQRTSVTTKRSF